MGVTFGESGWKSVQRCLRLARSTGCGSPSIVVPSRFLQPLTANGINSAMPSPTIMACSEVPTVASKFQNIFLSLGRPGYKDPILTTHGFSLSPPSHFESSSPIQSALHNAFTWSTFPY